MEIKMKKKKKISKKITILSVAAILIWLVNFYFIILSKIVTIYIPSINETTTTTVQENVTIIISKKCNLNSDCFWQSTNCCPETAGAYWQCINANVSVIKCVGNILCPQFISPKPTTNCSCKQGECVG
jgi:hypothetical protein